MSHATARQPSSTGQPSLDDLVGFGFKLLSLSIDTLRTVVQEAPRLLPQSLDATPSRGQCVCEIPETECPPRCICDVTWEATLGETPSLTVRVTNSGGRRPEFPTARHAVRRPRWVSWDDQACSCQSEPATGEQRNRRREVHGAQQDA